jgi:hypothetical protein
VNVAWGVLITLAVAGVAIGAMLLVRRRAPEGSYFTDGDRASGVFGVIATGFSVLLGFIIFLAFTSYDTTRSGAETEALMVAQQVPTAQFFPAPASGALTGELVCYARFVVNDEWPRMRAGTIGNTINPWGVAMFKTLRTVDPKTPSEQSAYDQWLGQTSQREQARLDRIHGADGVIPTQLWFVLFFIALIVFVYMLFFADPGEGAATQAMLMGGVSAVLTAMLLVLASLDRPYHSGVGGLKPTAMERTLDTVDQALTAIGGKVVVPCGANGVRAGS